MRCGRERSSNCEEENQYKRSHCVRKNHDQGICCSSRHTPTRTSGIRKTKRRKKNIDEEVRTTPNGFASAMFSEGKTPRPVLGVNAVNVDGEGEKKRKRKRMRKRKRKDLVLDEAGRLLRRTRYLLIRMKLEQNLIDAYSGEGWKGQSREKIRPENELHRARKQILNCKAGIRDAIHQIELQSCEGCIESSVMHPDGSVHHEHIFCAKCKSREAFPKNDIILCDGACNRAFHQKCLDPPLEKIPPGDQGWLCSLCECKMEILESVNAHLGTSFSVNSRWEDVFEEAEVSHDDVNMYLGPQLEWPSEDSEDDDYNPEINESNNIVAGDDYDYDDDDDGGGDDSCTSSLYEASIGSQGMMNDGNPDAASVRRQRRDVDYKKLYDEMFGKDEHGNEESDEDEDWGPRRRGQVQRNQLDSNGGLADDGSSGGTNREPGKRLFRIPREAVQKLRRVFAENELPSMAVREGLSRELGLSADKISQWFKNARYAALTKIRKANLSAIPSEIRKENFSAMPDEIRKANLSATPDDIRMANLSVGPEDERAGKPEEAAGSGDERSPLLEQVERLCSLSEKVARFKAALRACCEASSGGGPRLVYLPVAELREKM